MKNEISKIFFIWKFEKKFYEKLKTNFYFRYFFLFLTFFLRALWKKSSSPGITTPLFSSLEPISILQGLFVSKEFLQWLLSSPEIGVVLFAHS